jgi:hypothetical protein
MPDGTSFEQDGDTTLHRRLARMNRARMTPCLPGEEVAADTGAEAAERDFLHAARLDVAATAADAPADPRRFLTWFEDLASTGPGQGHELFAWLRDHASLEQMRWFLRQEVAGEAGFEDLTALTQVRMPRRAKLELARNYWDEMGRGQAKGMHGPMLDHMAAHLDLRATLEATVWEALALANTMTGLAYHRHYAFQAVGALGVVELTAPRRAGMVAQGLKRLGVPDEHRHYFSLHAVLDVQHAASWNAEIILPLIEGDRRRAAAIAEGALMRLACGARCFDRYRREIMLPS